MWVIVLNVVVMMYSIALTKLDVLDDQSVVKIAAEYVVSGQTIDYYPSMSLSLSVHTPVNYLPYLLACKPSRV